MSSSPEEGISKGFAAGLQVCAAVTLPVCLVKIKFGEHFTCLLGVIFFFESNS